MVRDLSRESYTPEGYIDYENEVGDVIEGGWRQEDVSLLRNLNASQSTRSSKLAEKVRSILTDHFWGPGQIPWQWKYV